MGEAVQHRLSAGQVGNCPAIVLLIQEKAGLLAVLHVHQVLHTVFHDLRYRRLGRLFAGQGIPALALRKALFFPQGHIVAQKDAPDGKAILPQQPDQRRQQNVLNALHAHGEYLYAQKVPELVHGQTGEGVGLSEDDPTGVQILGTHDRLAVFPGPAELALPEGLIKAVVGVAADEAHADLGMLREKAGAKIPALFADHVYQGAVFHVLRGGGDLLGIDPGMAPVNGSLRLGRDGKDGVASLCFHRKTPFGI